MTPDDSGPSAADSGCPVVLPVSLQLICTSAASPIRNSLNLIRSGKLAESGWLARAFLMANGLYKSC